MVAFVAYLNQDRFWYIWHSSTQAGKYLVVSTLIYFFYFFIAFKITSVTIFFFFGMLDSNQTLLAKVFTMA